MNFNNRNRSCVVIPSLRPRAGSERSEGSILVSQEILRCAQDGSTIFGRESSLSRENLQSYVQVVRIPLCMTTIRG
jgi:hypothetical protein